MRNATHGRAWRRVEGQERIDAMAGAVRRAAEHNAKVSHLLDLPGDGNQSEVASLQNPPQTLTLNGHRSDVVGPEGGTATFAEIETASGKEPALPIE